MFSSPKNMGMTSKLGAIGGNLTTFLTAMVPVFKSCPPCPICMPKYAAIFAFFGLKLADYSHYLVPIMLISMLLSLGSMYYQISRKQLTIYPFVGALLSCILLLVFKYSLDNVWLVYAAMLGLFGSIVLHYRLTNKSCCKA